MVGRLERDRKMLQGLERDIFGRKDVLGIAALLRTRAWGQ